jgi:diaminopimelate decarboxylase
MDHFHLVDGTLHCEGVSLKAIAAAAGTPTYVYSAATMDRHAAVMQQAVAGAGTGEPLVAYAVKANPNAHVLARLGKAGLGADVVSIGEYRRARSAGIAPERIVFSGVGKTAEEMAEALTGGLLQFNVESMEEARTLSAVAEAQGREAPMGFRINPDVSAGTHAKITTGTADNKFGIAAGDALEFTRAAASLPGLAVHGVTVHIGSQLVSLDPLEQAFRRLGELIAALRDDGRDIRIADLGGGLGVPHGPGQPEPPSPEAYGAMVRRVIAGWNTRLLFEPGRLIVGNAGVLLTRVVRVKPGVRAPWLIVDAGMNDLMRPALYDAYHRIEAVRPSGVSQIVNVVGPVCETGDTFTMGRDMDRVEAGDLIVFRTAGAYGATLSSGYNSRPLAAEVLVEGDCWALIRRRVDPDALAGVERPEWR